MNVVLSLQLLLHVSYTVLYVRYQPNLLLSSRNSRELKLSNFIDLLL